VARMLSPLITSAALTICLAATAFAGCPVTGDEMDMMTGGGEATCFAATPAAGIASAGVAATTRGGPAGPSTRLLSVPGGTAPVEILPLHEALVIGSGSGGALSI
jgi:hypothetical protein